MDKDCLDTLFSWFNSYVEGFLLGDSVQQRNIQLKKEHTLRVVKNILALGESLCLSQDQLTLARIIALFHDIGRFEQFQKYGTFKDGRSENHALIGVRVLEENKVLFSLGQLEQQIVYAGIKYHNICDLPTDLPQNTLLYAKLIRDADKLDIFKLLTEYYEERENNPNPALEELPDTNDYSRNFVQDILQHRNLRYDEVKSFNDMTLLRLSWIFDLNFSYSLEKVRAAGYLEKFIRSLPATPEIKEIHQYLQEYLLNKLRYL